VSVGGGAPASAGMSASAATPAVGGTFGNAGARSSAETPADGGSSAGSGSAGSAGMASRALPVASPGCALAKGTPTETGVVSYALPDSYDGVAPWPLIIELPATNVPPRIAVTRNGTKALNQRYVVVAPRPYSVSYGSFEGLPEADFVAQLEADLAEVCFDESRVFGAGNGSGGRVLMQRFVPPANPALPALRAVAVVGSFTGKPKPPTPTLFIHSANWSESKVFDDVDGKKALDVFLTGNACSDSSTPLDIAACSAGALTIDPHCVEFDDCVAAVRWCQPDDLGPTAASNGDGWPCFANEVIDEFFSRYLD